MMIEHLTELQWLARGRILKSHAVGVWLVPKHGATTQHHYYSFYETESRPERAARRLKKHRANLRKARKATREREAQEAAKAGD